MGTERKKLDRENAMVRVLNTNLNEKKNFVLFRCEGKIMGLMMDPSDTTHLTR